MSKFKITFFGTSGSSATSSEKRRKYGNNTSCALVQAGEHFIILDMGSGLVQLANAVFDYNVKSADVLLSHFHYDHIEGFPFFTPFYSGGKYTIHGEKRENPDNPGEMLSLEEIFARYMRHPFFPVTPTAFCKELSYKHFEEDESFFLGGKDSFEGDILIDTIHTNHPDFATAYKINYDGKVLVHLLDHEHISSEEGEADQKRYIEFCRDADLVIYDAYFTREEYNSGRYFGWGHSTYTHGIEFCKSANIKKIAFSHHAVWRSDNDLDSIEMQVQQHLPNGILARERLVINL